MLHVHHLRDTRAQFKNKFVYDISAHSSIPWIEPTILEQIQGDVDAVHAVESEIHQLEVRSLWAPLPARNRA
jgi:hypothetical protein